MSRTGLKSLVDDRLSKRARVEADSARLVLRHATAQAHARVDALFSRFDLTTRPGYVAFLRGQAGAHLAVEAALDDAQASRVIPDWPARRRSAALRADLRALGVDLVDPVEPPTFAGEAHVLGGAYVLEGSRLGGALLRRSVPSDMPAAFLGGTAELWRAFVALLDNRLDTPALIDHATLAALATFAAYERSAELALEATRP